MAEIDDATDLLESAGLNALEVLFSDRGDGYADWCHDIALLADGREAAHGAIGYAVTQLSRRESVAPMVGRQRRTDVARPARPGQPRWLAPTTR